MQNKELGWYSQKILFSVLLYLCRTEFEFETEYKFECETENKIFCEYQPWSFSPSRKSLSNIYITVSTWIKQTVILCSVFSDQEALTLQQVKAHDVRVFAASKAS